MNYKKVTRDQIATYLNTIPSSEKTWNIVGVGVSELGQNYNPQVNTEKWIIHKNATSSLESYQIQGDVSQKCYFGDPVFDFVNNLRRIAGVGSAVETQVLDIDLYDSTGDAPAITYKATEYDCIVVINSYASGETPVIEYTIHYNGDPRLGTVSIADKKPTFTPDAN